MSSLAVVPVYYQDQNAFLLPTRVPVSRVEARRLKAAGEGKFIEHGRKFRLKACAPALRIGHTESPLQLLCGPIQTATTITCTEAEANVGIASHDALVRRAQHKIRVYPHVFDKLAVLANHSWMRSSIQIAVAS